MITRHHTSSTEAEDILRWHSNRAFIYFGRLAPSKGIHVILRCWLDLLDKYADSCPPLWIIGGTPKEINEARRYAKLECRLYPHERTGRIVWWGYLDSPGVSAVLLRAIAVIAHSHYEPGGRVILEAMRQGVPAIATPHGFAPDLIEDWVSGFLVPYGDENQLRHRMSLFIHQPFLSQALGEQARIISENALKKWDFFANHCKIYDTVARKQSLIPQTAFRQPKTYPSVLKRRLVRLCGEINSTEELSPIVEKWAKSLLGEKTEVHLQNCGGKSHSWHASSSLGALWIKHIHSHFRMTSAWLQYGPEEPYYNASAKFGAEIFNADGLVETLWSNPEYMLVAQPVCKPLDSCTSIIDQAKVMRQALDLLAKSPCPADSETIRIMVRKYSYTPGGFDCKVVQNELNACPLNKRSPWPLSYRISLRLRFTLLLQAAVAEKLLLPDDISNEFVSLRHRLRDLAEHEEQLPIVFLHNGAKTSHFVRSPDGSVVLLDKERVSFGFKGKDQGELCANLAIRNPRTDILELVDALSNHPEETNVIICWMGLHILAEIGFLAACERHEKLSQAKDAWKRWRQVLVASQLS